MTNKKSWFVSAFSVNSFNFSSATSSYVELVSERRLNYDTFSPRCLGEYFSKMEQVQMYSF